MSSATHIIYPSGGCTLSFCWVKTSETDSLRKICWSSNTEGMIKITKVPFLLLDLLKYLESLRKGALKKKVFWGKLCKGLQIVKIGKCVRAEL